MVDIAARMHGTGVTKRVRSEKKLGMIVIKILNKRGLKIKKIQAMQTYIAREK
jgi:hypothetical protein